MHMQHIIMRTRFCLIFQYFPCVSAALREAPSADYCSQGSSDFPKCP